jgi:DNA-binding MarR family transcriptional regulator
MAEPRWLSDEEQQAWRTFLRAGVLLLERLDAELEEAHGMSLADYEVLADLSEAPGGRLRMRDLAEMALVSRSRLTHAVDRLQAAGLVGRERCPGDRRGVYAVLTAKGRRLLEEAAPTHVEGVRRYLMDCGSAAELTRLTSLFSRVTRTLAEADRECRVDAGDGPVKNS